MNSKIKDIYSREELDDFIQKTISKDAIPELSEKILSYPSGTIISFVCRQFDPVLGHRQQAIRVFHKLGQEMITDKPNKGKCIYKTLKVECNKHPTCDGYAKKEKECPLAEIINKKL